MLSLSAVVFWSLVVYLVLGRGRSPVAFQRLSPRLGLASALAAFGVAPVLSGSYEQEVLLFIGGPYAYRVETIERSYAALAAGIGVVALALAAVGRWAGRFVGADPWVGAYALTVGLILLRVALEKLGVPLSVATFFGIIWLVFPLPVLFGLEAARRDSQGRFWYWLVGYALAVRFLIVAVMLVATHFELGTHFDNSGITRFEVLGEEHVVAGHSWDQYSSLILFPQLALWTGVTLLAGALFGWPSYVLARWRRLSASAGVGPGPRSRERPHNRPV